MTEETRYQSLLWWKSETVGRDMVAIAKAIEGSPDHTARRRQNLRHVKLYSNRDLSSLYDCGAAIRTYTGVPYLTMNVVQSCTDTVASKVWKTPRIQSSVQDGDWSLKQRAKKITRFADGLWYVNKWTGESRQVGNDAALCGTGVVQVYGDDTVDDEGEVIIERVLNDELIFDETEAIDGLKSLQTLYRKRWVHKELLLERWADYGDRKDREARRDAIRRATGANPRDYYATGVAEMVPVYEGWHLPGRRSGKDGRHVIAIEGMTEAATLFDGPWTRKRFPFSFLPWTRLTKGLMARSLAEELVPIQIKINETLETIDAGQRLMCVPKVFYKTNTINMETWTNAFAELIQVNGDPASSVMVTTPPGVSAEIYRERDHWWRHAFEVTGVSMLSATAEKPEGVGSAVALRELLDREDMRLTPKGKQWEEFNVDVFENCIDAADELAERKRKVMVQVPGKKDSFSTIQWTGPKGVNMERDKFMLRADATSALPSTPQGRKQYAVELWQLGAVNREQFLQMLELPDTTSTMNLILASIEITERAMEIMVEEQRYEPPEEYADLVLSQTIAMQTYLRERMDGAPERVLLHLLRYVDECVEMLAANDNAQAPPVAQAQIAAAQGAPQPGAPVPPGADPLVPQPLPPGGPGELQPVPGSLEAQVA